MCPSGSWPGGQMLLDPGRLSPTTRPDWNRSRSSEADLSHPPRIESRGHPRMRRPSERRGRVRSLELGGLATRRKRKDDSKVGGRYHLGTAPSGATPSPPRLCARPRKKAMRIGLSVYAAPTMRIDRAPSEGYAHTAKRSEKWSYAHRSRNTALRTRTYNPHVLVQGRAE